MNAKAIYYALSRMFLPTLSIIIIALMWTLNPTKTFDFILSDNHWAAVLRIVLLLAEMAWFYYLYESFLYNEEVNKEIDELKYDNLSYSDVYDNIRDNTKMNSQFSLKHLKNKNTIILKYKDKDNSNY